MSWQPCHLVLGFFGRRNGVLQCACVLCLIGSSEEGKESVMKLNANGLSHLGLRVTNLARAKHFYVDTLGCQVVRETDGGVLVNVAGMLVALNGNDSSTDHFDPFRVGLDHLALAVEDPGILADLKRDLDAAGV